MFNPQLSIIFILFFGFINASLLFWSTKDIQIPSLKYFNEDDFERLLSDLENPQIIAFQNDFSTTDHIPDKIENFYSAYVPNGNMYIENVTALSRDRDDNLKMIKDTLVSYRNDGIKNTLLVVSSPNIRVKRDFNGTEDINQEELQGPVLYNAQGKAMIYSSKPVILKTSNESYALGNTSKTTVNQYAKYVLFSTTIPLPKNPKQSITLKFTFQQLWGYWSLPNVQVEYAQKWFHLNVSKPIQAENNYSYHCYWETVFEGKDMKLIFYEIQVQPYTENGRFSNAYDCVPFTTVAIWSGLMVSFTLILGLFIGFGALASIKTMDKFDNAKTKQLSFTVSE